MNNCTSGLLVLFCAAGMQLLPACGGRSVLYAPTDGDGDGDGDGDADVDGDSDTDADVDADADGVPPPDETVWFVGLDGLQGPGVVTTTSDGRIVMAASSTRGGVWLASLDERATILWQQTLPVSLGEAVEVLETRDGGLALLTSEAGDGSLRNTVVFRLGPDGAILWQIRVGHSGDLALDFPSCMAETADGGFVVGGGGWDLSWVFRTDARGEVLWHRSLHVGTTGVVRSVFQDADGLIVALFTLVDTSGAHGGQLFGLAPDDGSLERSAHIRVTVNGRPTVSQFYNAASPSTSASGTGGLAMVASIRGFNPGETDALVIELDRDWEIRWWAPIGTNGRAHQEEDTALVSRNEYNTLRAYPEPGGFLMSGFHLADADTELHLVRLDAAGEVRWDRAVGPRTRHFYPEDAALLGERPIIVATQESPDSRPTLIAASFDVDGGLGACPWPRTGPGLDELALPMVVVERLPMFVAAEPAAVTVSETSFEREAADVTLEPICP